MPKITHNSLVNLTAFRQRNGILQKDLADYLGVSRGYISMVESGRSRLSRENLDKLYENPYGWDLDDLVPAYTRVDKALYYLNHTRNEQRASVGLLPAGFTFSDEWMEDALKYGEIDVSDRIADLWCPYAPELNREWLLTGNGEMLVSPALEEKSQIEVLQEKVDKLEAAIEEYKNYLGQLIEALPETIINALQGMSSK